MVQYNIWKSFQLTHFYPLPEAFWFLVLGYSFGLKKVGNGYILSFFYIISPYRFGCLEHSCYLMRLMK